MICCVTNQLPIFPSSFKLIDLAAISIINLVRATWIVLEVKLIDIAAKCITNALLKKFEFVLFVYLNLNYIRDRIKWVRII